MKKEFFIKKREEFMEKVKDNSIVFFFSGKAPYKSEDEVYPFTPNRNFYYLTGIDRENIILMMTKINGKVSERLFIEENDPQLARWLGEKISKKESEELSGIKDINYLGKFHEEIGFLMSRSMVENVYLDLERQEWDIPLSLAQNFSKEITGKYPYLRIMNSYYIIAAIRMIKTEEELKNIKKAIKITEYGIYCIMDNVKPGMMEYEIEAYFDFTLKKNGVKDYAFKTIAAAGKNAAVLHYSDNCCKTNDNELIQFDLGAQWKYYNGDISRAIPLNGKFTKRQREIYEVVLKANKAVIENAKPGISFSELEGITRKVLAEGCIKLGLIQKPGELSKYYFHSFGHHLGLDTHDVGIYDKLEKGMVITDEPGLYIPEESIGIRIEDDLLITEDGCEVLTSNMIKEIDEIEEYMAKKNKYESL